MGPGNMKELGNRKGHLQDGKIFSNGNNIKTKLGGIFQNGFRGGRIEQNENSSTNGPTNISVMNNSVNITIYNSPAPLPD